MVFIGIGAVLVLLPSDPHSPAERLALFIGIGAVLALLFTLITFWARIRHARAVRLIHQTPVTPIGDLVQSFTAYPDPSTRTHAAVQGCVVARDTTRLTAPITGSSCVAYKVRVYKASDDDESDDTNYIEDSKWVPWAVDDVPGLPWPL